VQQGLDDAHGIGSGRHGAHPDDSVTAGEGSREGLIGRRRQPQSSGVAAQQADEEQDSSQDADTVATVSKKGAVTGCSSAVTSLVVMIIRLWFTPEYKARCPLNIPQLKEG